MVRFRKPVFAAGGISAALFVALCAHFAYAAAGAASILTTSPVSADLSAKPGSSVSTTLEVQNNGTQPVSIAVKLDEFKAAGSNGQAQIYTPAAGDAAATWVHFSETSFMAEPGVWHKVVMTINVPATAGRGYYYAVLFEPQTAAASTQNGTSKVKGANAVFVLLNALTPNEDSTLQVKSFSSGKSLYQYLPANFSVDVHNAGNIYTAPEGDIFISRSKNGPAIATLPINSGQGEVLPGTDRIFSASWADGFPAYTTKRIDGQIVSDKNGRPEQVLHWSGGSLGKFRFGKYYAHLVLVYNRAGQDVPVNAEVSFWVVPWKLLGGGLLVLVLVLFGVWTVLKDTTRIVRWFRRKPSAQ